MQPCFDVRYKFPCSRVLTCTEISDCNFVNIRHKSRYFSEIQGQGLTEISDYSDHEPFYIDTGYIRFFRARVRNFLQNESSEDSDGNSVFGGFKIGEIVDDVSDIDVGDISVSDVESSEEEVSDNDDVDWTDQFRGNFVPNNFVEETSPQLPAYFSVCFPS